MNEKQLQDYCKILVKYRMHVLLHEGKNEDHIQKIKEHVKTLAEKDPEFHQLVLDVEGYYWLNAVTKKTFWLNQIQDSLKQASFGNRLPFLRKKPDEVDDVTLATCVEAYRYDFQFRKACDAHNVFHKVIPSWIDEYQYRVINNGEFAKEALIRKMERFTIGKLKLEAPIEFDKTERDLCIQFYHTDTNFRNTCDNHNVIVRETVASWLEEDEKLDEAE